MTGKYSSFSVQELHVINSFKDNMMKPTGDAKKHSSTLMKKRRTKQDEGRNGRRTTVLKVTITFGQ